jgi:hypothetical protein
MRKQFKASACAPSTKPVETNTINVVGTEEGRISDSHSENKHPHSAKTLGKIAQAVLGVGRRLARGTSLHLGLSLALSPQRNPPGPARREMTPRPPRLPLLARWFRIAPRLPCSANHTGYSEKIGHLFAVRLGSFLVSPGRRGSRGWDVGRVCCRVRHRAGKRQTLAHRPKEFGQDSGSIPSYVCEGLGM